ncbi:MAG: LysR family transcriptional regulator [Vitreimonas sp.]
MARTNLNDLAAFMAVARERSFSRAAAQLGVSPSALSHAMRGLEERLGVRLLTRTTRSVSPTEAGERLVSSIGPRFDEIETELEALSALRDKPAGTIRLTAGDHVVRTIIRPKLAEFLPNYPDIRVEIILDNTLTNIVEDRFSAGIRLGEAVDKDMIAVRVGPDVRFALIGAPSYFATHAKPKTPQDLVKHSCINLRLPTYGGVWAWEFENDGRELRAHVDGQLTFNSIFDVRDAALDGLGLAFVPDDIAIPFLTEGRLVRVLQEWCVPWPGYHLYYPSRRQLSPAFALLVEALRYREDKARRRKR